MEAQGGFPPELRAYRPAIEVRGRSRTSTSQELRLQVVSWHGRICVSMLWL